MDSRTSRFWVILLASALVWITLVGAGAVRAANAPPVADAWNITSSGKAGSSGELLFRVSGDGRDPVEVTVFVLSGTNETGVASSIKRALDTQLDRQRFDVEAGEGANVLVRSESASRGFSLELIDSDVDDVRVSVQSATPVAPPTVPPQRSPANEPVNPNSPRAEEGAAPGESPGGTATNPAPSGAPESATPASPPQEEGAPPRTSTPDEVVPAPSGDSSPANGGAGAPASAPPPPSGTAASN